MNAAEQCCSCSENRSGRRSIYNFHTNHCCHSANDVPRWRYTWAGPFLFSCNGSVIIPFYNSNVVVWKERTRTEREVEPKKWKRNFGRCAKTSIGCYLLVSCWVAFAANVDGDVHKVHGAVVARRTVLVVRLVPEHPPTQIQPKPTRPNPPIHQFTQPTH